jgi:hypothetical protein
MHACLAVLVVLLMFLPLLHFLPLLLPLPLLPLLLLLLDITALKQLHSSALSAAVAGPPFQTNTMYPGYIRTAYMSHTCPPHTPTQPLHTGACRVKGSGVGSSRF